MIQEIAPHVYHNVFRDRIPEGTDYVNIFAGGKTYLTAEGMFPTVDAMYAMGVAEQDLVYLFSIDETAFFLLWNIPERVKNALVPVPTTVFRTMDPPYMALAGATALHLSSWYRTNQFCGRCGKPNRRDDIERAMRCTECGNIVYPRINPAIVVAVRNKDKILVTHYADRPAASRYALVAGFVEIGETFEDTVKREVLEEVGLPVKNVRYHASQPWGFAGNIMVGFWADLDGDDDTVTLDEEELDEGVWLSREEIPPVENPPSLTQTMIDLFRQGKDPK